MTDLYDDDPFLAEALEPDVDPVPLLGELPDCDDDFEACLVVGPADEGE